MTNYWTIFDEYRDLSLSSLKTRNLARHYSCEVASLTRSLSSNHLRKSTRKQLTQRLAYYSRQRDSIFNLYPELFL